MTSKKSPRKAKNLKSPVVSSLPKLPIPYSSLSISPDRQYAVAASKDTLHIIQINPKGLKAIKTIPVAQHFVRSTSADSRSSRGSLFGQNEPAVPSASALVNVVITDVAWNCGSHAEAEMDGSRHSSSSLMSVASPDGSLIAAAGSNGLIVVWNAEHLLGGSNAPEAVLSQHVRAVNRLDWHPTRPGLLLSASQDSKVLLWERIKAEGDMTAEGKKAQNRFNRIFGGMSAQTTTRRLFTWHCRATFEPKSEAVRDIKWSPYFEDGTFCHDGHIFFWNDPYFSLTHTKPFTTVFALVTSSGSLIAYNIHLYHKAIAILTAHAGEATTLDWHPKQKGIIATGGAGDRCVKIWSLLDKLTMDKDDAYMSYNSNTVTSRADSVNTDSSMDVENRYSTNTWIGGVAYYCLLTSLLFLLLQVRVLLRVSGRKQESCMHPG